MRKLTNLLLCLALLVSVCACEQAASGPTWQEQYDLGVRYLEEGNYKSAVLAFQAAIEIDPKQADAYIGLADAYVAQGDLDAAVRVLNDALSVVEDSASLRAKLDEINSSIEEEEPSPAPDLLSSIAYYGDVSLCALTPDQARTMVDALEHWSGVTESVGDNREEFISAFLCDGDNSGIPVLVICLKASLADNGMEVAEIYNVYSWSGDSLTMRTLLTGYFHYIGGTSTFGRFSDGQYGFTYGDGGSGYMFLQLFPIASGSLLEGDIYETSPDADMYRVMINRETAFEYPLDPSTFSSEEGLSKFEELTAPLQISDPVQFGAGSGYDDMMSALSALAAA